MPRFIISVREMYDRDLRSRWQGIDTGFGIISQPIFGGNTPVPGIEVVDVAASAARGQERDQVVEGEVDDSEAIQLEMLGDGTRQV